MGRTVSILTDLGGTVLQGMCPRAHAKNKGELLFYLDGVYIVMIVSLAFYGIFHS